MLSLGPQNVTIPALAGESLRVARIELLQAGLQLGEVTSYSVTGSSADTIMQQSPAPGTPATSLSVDLLVSQGEAPPAYVMPWLVGMQQTEVDRLISSAGLKPPKTTYAPSPQWPKGAVVDQTPGQGSKVTNDTPMEFVVAQ